MKARIIAVSLALLVLVPFSVAFAQDDPKPGTPSSTMTVHYDLPFPGMLPDNPLYKIKVFRDKLIMFLITDPSKKIDFYLLQADKGFASATALLDKGETALAIETALKAEHNMTLMSPELTRMPRKPEGSLFDRLKAASLTHQQLLLKMIKKTKGDEQKQLQQVLAFSKENLATLEKYHKKNPLIWNR